MGIILPFSFELFVLFCYCFFFFTPLWKFQILFSRKLPFYPIIACKTVASFSLFFCFVFVLFQASEGKRETRQTTRDTRSEGRNEYDNSIKPSLKTSFQFVPARFIVFVTAPLFPFYVIGKIGEKKNQQALPSTSISLQSCLTCVLPSRAPVLSCAHYFQAPATLAIPFAVHSTKATYVLNIYLTFLFWYERTKQLKPLKDYMQR